MDMFLIGPSNTYGWEFLTLNQDLTQTFSLFPSCDKKYYVANVQGGVDSGKFVLLVSDYLEETEVTTCSEGWLEMNDISDIKIWAPAWFLNMYKSENLLGS